VTSLGPPDIRLLFAVLYSRLMATGENVAVPPSSRRCAHQRQRVRAYNRSLQSTALCSYNTVHIRTDAMPRGKPKTKTAVMTLRVSPQVKAAAELAAERDHRSVTSLIEVLILDHCRRLDIRPETICPKETNDENSHAAPDETPGRR